MPGRLDLRGRPGQTYTNLGSVPWTALQAGDTVNIHFQPSLTYSILMSTDLASTNWTKVGSATAATNGNFQFADPGAASTPQRFYRASWP